MSFLKMFSKGFRSSLETYPIDNGTFKVATDTKQLFVDLDGERIELSDIVTGLTESEILDIWAPLPKVYLSSDTNKLYHYTQSGWAVVNKNEFTGTRSAVLQAIEDGIIQEGATVYITDDYTGDGVDLSIYCTYEYANENLVTKDELSEVTNPEYTKAESVSELSSGELLSVAFGKLAKAIADYISHKADTISHITEEERVTWNAKLGASDVVDNVTSTDIDKPLSANMGKELQEQITEHTESINSINSSMAEKGIITGILAAGDTSITISDERITTSSILSFYTSIYGVNPTSVNVSEGSVTLEFKAQDEDMTVGVSVDG